MAVFKCSTVILHSHVPILPMHYADFELYVLKTELDGLIFLYWDGKWQFFSLRNPQEQFQVKLD